METTHSFVRINTLLLADIFVELALFVLQDYLTSVWNLSFTHAAAIINFWGGISRILPVFFLFFADIVLGKFGALVISSIAYSVGIGFVAMSTPPILARVTKTCRSFKPECIGYTQKALLYSGLAFVAIGIAGHDVALKPYLKEQQASGEERRSRLRHLKLWCLLAVVVVALAGGIGIPYIKAWSIRFGITAIVTLLATVLFLTGWCTYYKPCLRGSPIMCVIKVFIASACNICKPFPLDHRQYRVGEDDTHQSFTHTRCLRCLHKAAIMSPEDYDCKEWKKCTIQEVEEAKITVRMIPMGLTFIVCGIVSSTGNTYFVEQAKTMNKRVGKLSLPPQVLLLILKSAKAVFSKMMHEYNKRGFAPSLGIAFAMISSILCCMAAALVENRRLNVIRSHQLLDHPETTIPVSIFWLTFQFILLAGLDSFLEQSVAAFYRAEAPESMTEYLEYFAKFVYGIGYMCSVLAVYVVGEVSERLGSRRSWFQQTLHRSRLDRYFWVLAALSSINLIAFIVVATQYRYADSETRNHREAAEVADPISITNDMIKEYNFPNSG